MTPFGLPMLKPREVVAALERLGFRMVRISKGSHRQFEHPDGRRTTVPVHQGRDIGPRLMRKVLRDIEMEPAEFRKWL